MDAIQRYEDSTRKEEEENLTEAEKQMRDEELSFYTNSENEFGDDNIWGLLSGVCGNIYEWYVFDSAESPDHLDHVGCDAILCWIVIPELCKAVPKSNGHIL